MADKPVKVEIVGDSSNYRKALDEAHDSTTKFGKVTEGAGSALKTAFVGGAVVAGIHSVVDAASDYNETVSKTKVVLGAGADAAIDFADTAAEAFGLSKQAALDAESTFAVFGKSAGLAGTDLSEFSGKLTGLAADMASFSNTSPEQAIEAIGAALRGESEPIRAYGVLLDDATLRQTAMEMGIYDGNGALTAQQKVLAAQTAIFKQTKDAQGDFARTSSGLAGQQKILAAEFENLKISLGQHLIPVAAGAIHTILAVGNAFSDMAFGADLSTDAFKSFFDQVEPHTIKSIGDELRDMAKAADESNSFLSRLSTRALDSSWDYLRTTFNKIGTESPEAFRRVYAEMVKLKQASDEGDPAAKKLADTYEITAEHLGELYDTYIKVTPAQAELERETSKLTGSMDGAGFAILGARLELQKQSIALAEAATEAGRAQRATDNMKASWDALKGTLSDQEAFIGIENSFDDVKQKGIDAMDAAKHHTADAEQKARDYDEALLGLRGQVIDYAKDVGGLPLDVTTMIQAQVDNGSIANANELLDAIAQARTVIYNAQVAGHREFAVPGNAAGTSDSTDTFIAGENGPELIVGKPHSTVFTADQTAGILGAGTPTSITINMPVGSNGADVVRALEQHVGRNGVPAFLRPVGGISGGRP